jgi:hypothetical protein
MKKNMVKGIIGALLVFGLALFTACDSDGDKGNGGGSVSGEQVYESDGTTPYTGDATVVIRLYDSNENREEVTVGKITGGKLTLTLPTTVEDKYLSSLPSSSESMTVTPDGVKSMTASFYLENGTYLEYKKAGAYSNYMYFTEAATVKGSYTYGDVTMTYNISAQKGWNIIYGTSTSATTTPISGLKWTLSDY